MARLLILLSVMIAVAGCGRAARNWFGGSEDVRARAAAARAIVDPRDLVAQVIAMRVEAVSGGAIVHATGLPQRQGYFDGDLVPLNDEAAVGGVLTYRFRISPPLQATPAGTQRSREVIVARFVSTQTLAGVRTIRVTGATNGLQARR